MKKDLKEVLFKSAMNLEDIRGDLQMVLHTFRRREKITSKTHEFILNRLEKAIDVIDNTIDDLDDAGREIERI
jgi:hypothetical protein